MCRAPPVCKSLSGQNRLEGVGLAGDEVEEGADAGGVAHVGVGEHAPDARELGDRAEDALEALLGIAERGGKRRDAHTKGLPEDVAADVPTY